MASTGDPQFKNLRVKQVLSGDSVVLQEPEGTREITVVFSNITAPKLARPARPNQEATNDEPYAWEAREYLRKRLVGVIVNYLEQAGAGQAGGTRQYGVIFAGKDKKNVTEMVVEAGLARVREGGRVTDERKKLLELQAKAKGAKRGVWDEENASKYVRQVKESPPNMAQFVEKCGKKPVKAVIESVRHDAAVRVLLLPDFYNVVVQFSGISCPPVKKDNSETPDTTEAKEALERSFLQRDVEIVLYSASNNVFHGSIRHETGDVAEWLLTKGYAKCVEWSMGSLPAKDAERLRGAEKYSKNQGMKIWKDQPQQPQLTGKEKEYQGTVSEVVNGDALMIKCGPGDVRKIFLSSIRPPRDAPKTADGADKAKNTAAARPARPLYDIPWLFEAREFLRKKLIGKRVNVVVDYKQAASQTFPEKTCCTVKIGGVNVAEALVSKGLATVVRHGKNDNNRSSCYDALLSAQEQALKAGKGLHGKHDATNRVTDVSADAARARTFLSSLQRFSRVEAVVEFVSSGSRLRLYIPKEYCLATFLLAGISCPRSSRSKGPGNATASPGDPYGDEALQFTRDLVMQREVEIKVDSMDKAGNFIGWVWVDGNNLSVSLVEEGLASVHFSAEKSEHYRALKLGEDAAKARKAKIWENYVEEVRVEEKITDRVPHERKEDYRTVHIVNVTDDLTIFYQNADDGTKISSLMDKMQEEFQKNPPLPGAYTPKRGELCASKFVDGLWYRVKIERVQGGVANVFFIDYGDRLEAPFVNLASLPAAFTAEHPYAHDCRLALVQLTNDAEYNVLTANKLKDELLQDKPVLLNVEYRVENATYVSIKCPDTKEDIVEGLIRDGYFLVERKTRGRPQVLVEKYNEAQKEARTNHRIIWEYGDITEDDAKEFGR